MNQKFNKNLKKVYNLLIFVFSLISIVAPASEYAWAKTDNEQLLHIDEKRKIYEGFSSSIRKNKHSGFSRPIYAYSGW